MDLRLSVKLICLAGAAFLGPFAVSPSLPLSSRVVAGLIGMFTTISGFLDKGVANLEMERKEQAEAEKCVSSI